MAKSAFISEKETLDKVEKLTAENREIKNKLAILLGYKSLIGKSKITEIDREYFPGPLGSIKHIGKGLMRKKFRINLYDHDPKTGERYLFDKHLVEVRYSALRFLVYCIVRLLSRRQDK